MILIKFYGLLRRDLGAVEIAVGLRRGSLRQALAAAEQAIGKPILGLLTDKAGEPSPGVMILVNGGNVRLDRNLETEVAEGDEIALFPPVGGG